MTLNALHNIYLLAAPKSLKPDEQKLRNGTNHESCYNQLYMLENERIVCCHGDKRVRKETRTH